ncbi:hypothetical protein MKEN_00146000 [Mycena kentingensis (nom. inval.)]|nr:hypothetical protein MKEN_00146000 [Mycena kentingensis (nom. inval.)]
MPGTPRGDIEMGEAHEAAATRDNDEDAWASKMWSVYIDEANKYDTALLDGWKSDMEGLVIFAALFSAILTAFIIESASNLSVSTGDRTVQLLARISAQLEASARGTVFQMQQDPPFVAPTTAIICNSLWFISLGLSLSAALLAILVQQWVRDFLHKTDIYSAPLIRARIFSFLYYGLKDFRMHDVVEILPLLLHLSLLLFFAGLVAFFVPVNGVITGISIAFLLLLGGTYTAVTMLPLVRLNSPYRTPLSNSLWALGQHLWGHIFPARRHSSEQPRSAMHAMVAAAKDFDVERDKHALAWTLKSTLGHAKFEPFAEAILHVLWGPESQRNTYKEHIEHLVAHPEIRLFHRVFALLRSCDSSALTAEARLHRAVIALKALWAIGTLAVPTSDREESDAAIPVNLLIAVFIPMEREIYILPGFKLFAPVPAELQHIYPAALAMIRWRGYCALHGRLAALHKTLRGFESAQGAGRDVDWSGARRDADHLYRQYVHVDGPWHFRQKCMPNDLPGVIARVSEWIFGLPYQFLFDFYAQTAILSNAVPFRFDDTVAAIVLDHSVEYSILHYHLRVALSLATHKGLNSENVTRFDSMLSALLAFWRPIPQDSIPSEVLRIIDEIPSDERLKFIMEKVPQLEQLLWEHLPPSLSETEDPSWSSDWFWRSGAIWRLALIYPAIPFSYRFKLPLTRTESLSTEQRRLLENVLATPSGALSYSTVALLKCNIFRYFDFLPPSEEFQENTDGQRCVNVSGLEIPPGFPEESVIPFPQAVGDVIDWDTLKKYLLKRRLEALIFVLAEFFEHVSTKRAVYRPRETLHALKTKMNSWFSTSVHFTHQRRFAKALARVLELKIPVEDFEDERELLNFQQTIFDFGLWEDYARPSDVVDPEKFWSPFADVLEPGMWLDDDEAKTRVLGAIRQFIAANPEENTRISAIEVGLTR